MNRSTFFSAVLLAVGLAACGCSGGSAGKVTGSVKMNGEPLAEAKISFLPKGSQGQANVATTDASGRFEVKPNPTTRLTLKPGTYVVLIGKFVDGRTGKALTPEDDVGQLQAQGRLFDIVPETYRNPTQSPLTVEIKTGDNALQPFELKGR
jgi:hypothetical protein